MADEVVTFETVLSKSKIDCYQCEKCGFIDTQSTEEFKAMPTEQQQFLMEHRNLCGGRFLPVEVVLKADVVALQTQLQEILKADKENYETAKAMPKSSEREELLSYSWGRIKLAERLLGAKGR